MNFTKMKKIKNKTIPDSYAKTKSSGRGLEICSFKKNHQGQNKIKQILRSTWRNLRPPTPSLRLWALFSRAGPWRAGTQA